MAFEWLPKVQKIAQSGHTSLDPSQLGTCENGAFDWLFEITRQILTNDNAPILISQKFLI